MSAGRTESGRFAAASSLLEYFEARYVPEPNTGCWLWIGGSDPDGYGSVSFGPRGGTLVTKAHRASWVLARGEIPPGLLVCHRCDTPPCVNPAHLFLGTHAENIADRHGKGRDARGERTGMYTHPEVRQVGEKHWKAKMTEEDVRTIRRLRAEGASLKDLSKRFNISEPSISAIATRRTWSHVT